MKVIVEGANGRFYLWEDGKMVAAKKESATRNGYYAHDARYSRGKSGGGKWVPGSNKRAKKAPGPDPMRAEKKPTPRNARAQSNSAIGPKTPVEVTKRKTTTVKAKGKTVESKTETRSYKTNWGAFIAAHNAKD